MSSSEPIALEGDNDLKGKDFDEVCAVLKQDDQVTGVVHKKPDGAGRWSFCFGFRANEYAEAELLELIVSEYGPGVYPVQFKGKQKSGRPKIRWQKDYHVQSRRPGAVQNLSVAPPSRETGNDALAAAMERQAIALEALAAGLAKPPPAPKTTIDFVQELGAIKDLFSDNRQSALEQFKDAMELRKLIKDDDGNGDGDPLSLALKTLAPAIEKGVEALRETETAGVRRPAAPDRLHAVAAATPDDVTAQPGEDLPADDETRAGVTASNEAEVFYAFKVFDKHYLPAILKFAEAGEDPQAVAEYLARLIGDDENTLNLVGLVIMQDDMVERFAKLNARALQFTAWLDNVADWLAHALWPATNPAPAPLGATDSATNGKTDNDGAIDDAETTGAKPAGAIASGESIPDAKPSADAQRTRNDNNA